MASRHPIVCVVGNSLLHLCETRGEAIEVLTGVLSSFKKEKETQTETTTPCVAVRHQGIDTHELEWGLRRLLVATQTRLEKVGTRVKEQPLVEAGHGDIKGDRDNILGGWELIWVENPWTGRCE